MRSVPSGVLSQGCFPVQGISGMVTFWYVAGGLANLSAFIEMICSTFGLHLKAGVFIQLMRLRGQVCLLVPLMTGGVLTQIATKASITRALSHHERRIPKGELSVCKAENLINRGSTPTN